MKKKENKQKEEKIKKQPNTFLSNIPNMLTILRFILTLVVAYMIFNEFHIITIIVVFAIAAITDFLDGRLARRYGWTSEFGRRADMLADRFLWVGTVLAFIISFSLHEKFTGLVALQLAFIMSREIISAPFAIIAFFSGTLLPQARYVAKVTTFIQGFALPSLFLSIYYPIWFYLSLPLSLACLITGLISGLYYLQDIQLFTKKK